MRRHSRGLQGALSLSLSSHFICNYDDDGDDDGDDDMMVMMMIILMTNISAPGAQWQQQPTSTNNRSKYFQIPIVYDGSLDFLGIAPFYGHFQDSVGVLLFKLSNPNFR